MAAGTQTAYDIDVADVEYLRHGDKPLLARLFKPRGSGPFPIMVELHGGAWVRGDRLNGNAANEALARNGVIVAALDFRVPPVAPYPASLADIHCGIRWCKTQAPAWNGRPDRIGAMGTSSGAHQAMLLGIRPRDPRYAALSLPAVATTVDGTLGCVIMVSPVIDPLGRYHYAKGLRQDCTHLPDWPTAWCPCMTSTGGRKRPWPRGRPRASWPVGSGRQRRPCCASRARTRRRIRARISTSSSASIGRLEARSR